MSLEPLTVAELRAMPATLDFVTVCRALRISQAQGYKLIAAKSFPVSPMPHSSRLYALADVIKYLGFDPAMIAEPAPAQRPAA